MLSGCWVKRMKKPITIMKPLYGQIRINDQIQKFDKIMIVKKENDSSREFLKSSRRNMTHVTYSQERSFTGLNLNKLL